MNLSALAMLLVGCPPVDRPEGCESDDVVATDDLGLVVVQGFPAPWDPVVVGHSGGWDDLDGSVVLPPVIGDGRVRILQPLLDPPLVTEASELYRFEEEPYDTELAVAGYWITPPDPGFRLDDPTCAGPVPSGWFPADERWTVGRYGRAPDFDPRDALGSWDVTQAITLAGGESAVSALASLYLDLVLEVLQVNDGTAEFRLVSRYRSACVVLHDEAALSSTGEFSWSKERLEADTEPAPLVLYGPRLRLGFDGTGTAAGGEGSVIADLRAAEGTETDVCVLLAGLGVQCLPCADDGHASCLPLAAYAWTATRTAAAVGEDLPPCGFDFSDTGVVPNFDCGGWDGSLCAVGAAITLWPVRRWRARRSRGRSGEGNSGASCCSA